MNNRRVKRHTEYPQGRTEYPPRTSHSILKGIQSTLLGLMIACISTVESHSDTSQMTESICDATLVVNKSGVYPLRKNSPHLDNLRLSRIDMPSKKLIILGGDRLFRYVGEKNGMMKYVSPNEEKNEDVTIVTRGDKLTLGRGDTFIIYKCVLKEKSKK